MKADYFETDAQLDLAAQYVNSALQFSAGDDGLFDEISNVFDCLQKARRYIMKKERFL